MSIDNQSSQEVINWNAIEDPSNPTGKKTELGLFFIRLAAVLFCAIALYLFAGVGGAVAVLVAGWFVIYKN